MKMIVLIALATGLIVTGTADAASKTLTERLAMRLTPLQRAQRACMSADTIDGLRRAIFPPYRDEVYPENNEHISKSLAEATITLKSVTVMDYKPDIELATCAASATGEFPKEDYLAEDSRKFHVQLDYTAQPAATGEGMVVSVERGRSISIEAEGWLEAAISKLKNEKERGLAH